jgi:hypothetical protein
MKFFLLDFFQKFYLNIVVFFDKFFNIGNGKKKRINLTGLSVNMIFYFFIYTFLVFVFDVVFFNEEFFISLGLVLFVLFVRSLLTEALMPFFFQYKNSLERSIYELCESIFLLSSKLHKYYSIELYFLRVLRENLYGIAACIRDCGDQFDKEGLSMVVSNIKGSGNVVVSVNLLTLNIIEQINLLSHFETFFRKIFGFFISEVFFIYFNFQYRLRLIFYANLIKNNLIVRAPLTHQEQAMYNLAQTMYPIIKLCIWLRKQH